MRWPWATGILPLLPPLDPTGLALTMVGAFITHLRRNKFNPMGIVNIVLFTIAMGTAIGRFLTVKKHDPEKINLPEFG
ncbi:MAG: hypothetical protein MUP11_09185 [Anaerolineales bacterium]|nr:hypothetical protein [Anaerolineales bacterium]